MPITKSAKKALRGSKKKSVFNLRRKTKMMRTGKALKKAVASGAGDLVSGLSDAYKAIDKAAKNGVIKKNTASRRKSQVAKLVSNRR
ncbi:MAG: 30S ribosomal protein S20 [Candidatus Vogelbacteria bacterium CG10_big_fil_rev_8_21_14_0_10_45_14]|uniref:Small ribosomal subunit protein bS20 n=1 Tax=Candidatus Vogelbacteria bacterium CG10_big_fil_rev_8_21_14_0_10_45_14 TaxID=1975042 RepID=A0A2H0RKQ1_9BACT|nr:MAG: 30S ribosomal protein S20 [Candidatus Vogelbacteria bacterium CG10_big_fil_rev_8_21_14_0_10_45_14]